MKKVVFTVLSFTLLSVLIGSGLWMALKYRKKKTEKIP